PLDVTATYNMAGYNYTLRDLGDGFAMFGGAVNVKDYVMEDYLVLANYAKSFPVENGYPTIKADNSVLGANYGDINGEGRITIVSEDPGPDTGEICNPHEYSEERVEPTCVTEGYVIYTCTLCGDSYKEILEATGVHEDADRNGECDHCGAAVEVKVEPGDLIGKYFEKVTEDQTDWTGVYMIVVEGVSIEGTATDVAFDGSLGSLDECFNYLEVTVADNKILADEETAASFFEIVKVDGGYTVRSASGLYIGPKDSGNGLSTTDDAAAAYASTITLNEDGTVNLSSSDGRNLRFNSTGSQLRFRYFKSAQTSIYLYKADVSIPGYEPEEPAAAEYTLTNELKAGDEVIIVNAALNKALSSTYSGFYNSAVDVAPVEGVITTDATDIVWTVGKDGDNYTFSFGGQNIGMQESYSSMPLGAVNDKWTITDGDTANTHFVCNVGRGAYMEYQDTYGTWSAYYDKSSNTQLFELSFYVKNAEGGETPEPDPEPTPDPSGDTYVLSAGLKDGDKVIIVNAAASKALSSEIVSTYYKAGADVTPADGKITTADTTIVWTVTAVEGGFELSNSEGQKLSMGASYSSIPYDDVNTVWEILTSTTENCVYVKNAVRGNYLQWSAQYSNYSTYTYSEANESTFAMQLYVLEQEEQPAPVNGLVATALEDIKATDKVLIVTTAGDTSYVLLNNADKGPAQAFDPEAWDDTMLWNIAAVDGGYTIYVNGSTTQWLYGTAANNGLCVGDTTTGSVFNFAVPYEGQNAYLTYTDSASAARYVGVYTATPNFRGYKIGNDGTLTSNITGQSTTFYVVTETTGN
ncbi:MAG: hypothetical protein IJ357_03185, partial [Oscillospiraceae bacterium]|nr:hypothetical protein [Oscillospiraceae bacterium]